MTDEKTGPEASILEQRRVLIEFGRLALKSDTLHEILDEVCHHVRDALGTDLSKVMRLEDECRNLRVIAGVGWEDGVVGEEVVPALSQSSEGYALRRGRPAVSHDVSNDDFDYPEFLKRHGVEAMLNVAIPGAEDQPPFGLLQVDNCQPREFTSTDIEFLQGYAVILGAAIERFQKSDALRAAISERERALAELQHRVSNNLAILKGLFRSKHRRAGHPEVQQEIASMLGQIEALVRLHELLSASSDIDRIEIGGFLTNLASQIGAFGSEGDTVCEVNTATEPVIVDSSVAIPLGIVTNEFITNSIKYASHEGRCAVRIAVARHDDHVAITLSDQGGGLGDALERRLEDRRGSGLNFIEALIKQVGADHVWSTEKGTQLEIRLPLGDAALTADI